MMTGSNTRWMKVAALAGAALLLASCASGQPTSDGEEDAAPTINVVWKGDADRAAAVEAAIELYQEANPDVVFTTDYQSGDEFLQKLSIRFASNDAPDLMRQERLSLREYADRGVLADLNELESLDTSALPQSVIDSGLVDGKLYGLPGGVTSLSFVVDAGIYEQYGVELPDTETWSWDDYRDSAAAITEASDGAVWGTDFPIGDLTALGTFLRQNGEDVWTADGEVGFTEDTVEEWFEMWIDFKDAGATPPGGAVDVLGVAADQSLIGRGLAASMIVPPNSFAAFNSSAGGTLELADFPGESQADQRGQQIIPSMYWSISASADNPEAVGAFFDFLLNDVEANRLIGSTHGVPANPEVADAVAADLAADDKIAFDYITELGQEDLTAPVPDPAGSGELTSSLASIGDQIKFGQVTPKEAAAQFFEAAQSTLSGS